MPWINVIANPSFGFIISSTMSGFTYAYNSQTYKITSWSNDIIADPPSEFILFNKQRFVPTTARHGTGYSIFTALSHAFRINIKVFAALETQVKYYLIEIENITSLPQNISIDFIAKMVLGTTEEKQIVIYYRNGMKRKIVFISEMCITIHSEIRGFFCLLLKNRRLR